MSEAVFFYQVAILFTTIGTVCIANKRVATAIALIWLAWTVTMVFTSWLYLLQTIIIAGALITAYSISKRPDFPRIQKNSRRTAFAGVVLLGIAAIGSFIYSDRHKVATSPYTEPALSNLSPPQKVDAPELLYRQAVTEVEHMYPALNPDLPGYDPQLMQQVMSFHKKLLSENVLPHVAVRKAADMVMQERSVYKCKNNVYQDSPCIPNP